jgi:hypothetical protein
VFSELADNCLFTKCQRSELHSYKTCLLLVTDTIDVGDCGSRRSRLVITEFCYIACSFSLLFYFISYLLCLEFNTIPLRKTSWYQNRFTKWHHQSLWKTTNIWSNYQQLNLLKKVIWLIILILLTFEIL